MLFVWIFLILGAFFIIALVDFVLRNPMFAETFVIKIGIPFTHIEYTKEHVEFIYIIAGSLLLGALVIAVSTWVLDAKRKLKVRSLRKELKNLQKSVEEAQASLPQQDGETLDDESVDVAAATEPQTETPEGTLSPEEITKSFEDVVDGGDFLEKPVETEAAEEDGFDDRPSESEEDNSDTQTEEDSEGADDEGKSLPQMTTIEAEVVDSDEQVEQHGPDEDADKKKESDHV